MIFEIPVLENTASWQQRTALDGTDYILEFNWNGRGGAWYLSILDLDGNAIVRSIKLVSNWPLLRRRRDERLPPGELMMYDATGEISSAGYDQLGRQVTLNYFDAEELGRD